jgi:hypothetical protein
LCRATEERLVKDWEFLDGRGGDGRWLTER